MDTTISDTPLHRSTHISNMSKGILEENSCAYTQFPAEEKEPVNVSLPGTGHTPEGYVHFTFNDDKWCNLMKMIQCHTRMHSHDQISTMASCLQGGNEVPV